MGPSGGLFLWMLDMQVSRLLLFGALCFNFADNVDWTEERLIDLCATADVSVLDTSALRCSSVCL